MLIEIEISYNKNVLHRLNNRTRAQNLSTIHANAVLPKLVPFFEDICG